MSEPMIEHATDIVKCWLAVGDRISGALGVLDTARRQTGRKGSGIELLALDLWVSGGMADELPRRGGELASWLVASADTLEVVDWLDRQRYTRFPDPVAALIDAWGPAGFG